MKKTFFLLATVATFVAASPVLAADKETIKAKSEVQSDSEGNYKRTTSVKENDAAGTTTKEDSKVEVKADKDGTVEKTTEVKTSTDPKGLMNKTTESVKDTVKTSPDGTKKVEHKKKVNGEVVEDKKTETHN